MDRMTRISKGEQEMTDKEFAFYEMLGEIKEALDIIRMRL